MADQYPSWWSASANSEPQPFSRPEDVPAGWVLRPGSYDTQIGQFVTVEQAEELAAEKRAARENAAKIEAAELRAVEKAAEPVKPVKAKPRRRKGRRQKRAEVIVERDTFAPLAFAPPVLPRR